MESSIQHIKRIITKECHLMDIADKHITKGKNFAAYLKNYQNESFQECVAMGVQIAQDEHNKSRQQQSNDSTSRINMEKI